MELSTNRYIRALDASFGSTTPDMTVGDRIVRCSASFGEEIWDAENYGQVVYALKTRNGSVYMQLEKRGGDLSVFEEDEVDDITRMQRTERAGGNVGLGTREKQKRNYQIAVEKAQKRVEMFESALKDYTEGDLEKALITWEEVLGMEPPNYIGDDGQRVTDVFRVTAFNIACVYSRMGQVDNGLDALDKALKSGFDDYRMVTRGWGRGLMRACAVHGDLRKMRGTHLTYILLARRLSIGCGPNATRLG